MYLGIDLGTSSLKILLVDQEQKIIDQQSEPISTNSPQLLWMEQDPNEWWQKCQEAIMKLKFRQSKNMQQTKAIGLSGQMHGATLLDRKGKILYPAILWNDGRSYKECQELENKLNNFREITGNIAMPGFTAPKLIWVAKNRPDIFKQISTVLLPKDYLRFCMSGDYASDVSDSAGTLWVDVKARKWSDEIIFATEMHSKQMPKLYESCEITGTVLPNIAKEWGIPTNCPIVAGGSDNAASAIGIGIINDGDAFLSLGTSGVIFSPSKVYRPNFEEAVHTFCHALPSVWSHMSVMLNVTCCLDWISKVCNKNDITNLLEQVKNEDPNIETLFFLPYLCGERTPHNDVNARGSFNGINLNTTHKHLVKAVLEGVGFALADGLIALKNTKVEPKSLVVVGGGSHSDYWLQMISDILQIKIQKPSGSEMGASIGACRLAQLAKEKRRKEEICFKPKIDKEFIPDTEKIELLEGKHKKFRFLYQKLQDFYN